MQIMTKLLEEGHEIFALDWLGHGLSDKPKHHESVTFELHMRTLIAFFNHVQLKDAILVAHSWGGCVALCSIPRLPSSSCSGLFLINSFLPHRPHEMSRNCRLLYAVWFLLSRVLDGYVSESTITRFISPDILEGDVEGYEAPYRHLSANARPSVEDFAYMGTGIPHFLLKDLRETPLWKIFEAICGPRNFSELSALALLSERGDNARSYWQSQQPSNLQEAAESRLKIAVVFGERDPLVENYKETLVRVIGKNNMADWAPDGIWLQNAGHYPMEDKPEDVARLIARLA
ncbi:uncharacterized protein N7482_010705 [Penicillium canariense]|uniref:AB hydrolase-1 domain-containing protein n=1 Tax=Penicillium canariense TaxID=189055 RepID=A0A9W9HMI9_9EURO|nr:uncharacterized protein N7482_010705 [Penicillium canariense]KAJ5151453.1 hypothetical protein N7482_010705 [Penicillium canariense]